jgi:hypothetical protein
VRILFFIENLKILYLSYKSHELAGTERSLKRRWLPIANTPTLISCAEAAPTPCICCRPFSWCGDERLEFSWGSSKHLFPLLRLQSNRVRRYTCMSGCHRYTQPMSSLVNPMDAHDRGHASITGWTMVRRHPPGHPARSSKDTPDFDELVDGRREICGRGMCDSHFARIASFDPSRVLGRPSMVPPPGSIPHVSSLPHALHTFILTVVSTHPTSQYSLKGRLER